MKINEQNWEIISRMHIDSMKSSAHASMATVGPDGTPHITPIGSLILTEASKGFFFDEFPKNMANNLSHNPQVCVMFVNSSRLFWLKSLFFGKFASPPGIRLYGAVSEKREAAPQEIESWQQCVKSFRKFKGYHILWSRMKHVRDIYFNRFRPVQTGEMTRGLWQDSSEQ